jgi:predicted DNA-binding transcriptional regulator YafY
VANVRDPLERLTNLLALLLETAEPLTQQQITDELGDFYGTGEAGRHSMFERDKRELRAIGVPIEQQVLGGDRAGQTAYRVDRARYELGDLGLTDDERQALQLAAAAVHLEAAPIDQALWKLGAAVDEAAPAPVEAHLPSAGDALATLVGAIGARAEVGFTYREQERTVQPYGVLARDGSWYLAGHDRGRDAVRTFRVDRIRGPVRVGDPGSFERPDGLDVRALVSTDPKSFGEPGEGEGVAAEAVVLVEGPPARAVERELGDSAVVERRRGGVVVRVPCATLDAFRWWVLGFGEQAEVLEPAEVRGDIVAWLEATAGSGAR